MVVWRARRERATARRRATRPSPGVEVASRSPRGTARMPGARSVHPRPYHHDAGSAPACDLRHPHRPHHRADPSGRGRHAHQPRAHVLTMVMMLMCMRLAGDRGFVAARRRQVAGAQLRVRTSSACSASSRQWCRRSCSRARDLRPASSLQRRGSRPLVCPRTKSVSFNLGDLAAAVAEHGHLIRADARPRHGQGCGAAVDLVVARPQASGDPSARPDVGRCSCLDRRRRPPRRGDPEGRPLSAAARPRPWTCADDCRDRWCGVAGQTGDGGRAVSRGRSKFQQPYLYVCALSQVDAQVLSRLRATRAISPNISCSAAPRACRWPSADHVCVGHGAHLLFSPSGCRAYAFHRAHVVLAESAS